MKTIKIKGKNNIDNLSGNAKITSKRCSADYEEPCHKIQLSLINKYYMGHSNDFTSYVSREISRKISGYKSQDIKKEVYDQKLLVSENDIIEKLVVSKMICFYCRSQVKVLFTGIRDERQWTLDRIDNRKCHSNENTVISCLQCNLKRRVTDFDKFNFTQKLVISKVE